MPVWRPPCNNGVTACNAGVFLCTLTHDDQVQLADRIHNMIDTATDSVYLIDLCGTCWNTVQVLGQATVAPPPLYWAVL